MIYKKMAFFKYVSNETGKVVCDNCQKENKLGHYISIHRLDYDSPLKKEYNTDFITYVEQWCPACIVS